MRRRSSRQAPRALHRRDLLRWCGTGYLGLSLPALLRAQAAAASSAAGSPIRACIFVFYYGGPSQLDTFDPKPDAPAEIRGEFKSIATSVPGIRVSEHLPHMARSMHRVALVRSMHHAMRGHDAASGETLTGRTPATGDQVAVPETPQTFPSLGAMLSYAMRGRRLPVCHAALPFVMQNVIQQQGQTPGFLGPAYGPLQVNVDGTRKTYGADSLRLPEGMTPQRLQSRRALREQLAMSPWWQSSTEANAMQQHYARAFELLQSPAVERALDIEQEPPAVRERYGMLPVPPAPPDIRGAYSAVAADMRGQNLLLARRLVEADVPFVNVYDFRNQGPNWDTHIENFRQNKEVLLPQADQALAALIEDLAERGLLDSTLVVAAGEFGRTPLINKRAGRDHWPDCYSVLLAGGGIHGGMVFGASDKHGAYPASDAVTPADLAATIFWRFGIDPATEMHDLNNRPFKLAEGTPLRGLFGV